MLVTRDVSGDSAVWGLVQTDKHTERLGLDFSIKMHFPTGDGDNVYKLLRPYFLAIFCMSLAFPTLALAALPTPLPQIKQQVKISNNGGVLTLFSSGDAYFSADGKNIGGPTQSENSLSRTIAVYGGSATPRIASIVAAGGGVDILFDTGIAYFSRDGQNLGGGGNTIRAYQGSIPINQIVAVNGGVDTIFSSGLVYFSPDGQNLGGGGATTVNVYAGPSVPTQIIPVGSGVITMFGSAAYFSPDNRNLGGGGNTIHAYEGPAQIAKVVPVVGGIETLFTNGSVYFSPDGMNLGGGGRTIGVTQGTVYGKTGNQAFGPRDSAKGAIYNGKLFLSSGYRGSITGNSACQSDAICSYYDLWYSSDWGSSWTLGFQTNFVSPADMQPSDFYYRYSAVVPFQSQLLAVGPTVWSSPDGISNWRQISANGPGPVSELVKAFVLNNVLYYVNGEAGTVSTSADGINWTTPSSIPGFTPRCGPAVASAQGKLWIMGGASCDYATPYDDIWSSADGTTWTRAQTSGIYKKAEWAGRMWPCVATDSAGNMWLAGGYSVAYMDNTVTPPKIGFGFNLADVWYSRDGLIWRQYKPTVGSGLPDDGWLEPRHSPTCYVRSDANTLIIAAGKGGADPHENNEVQNTVRTLALPSPTVLP